MHDYNLKERESGAIPNCIIADASKAYLSTSLAMAGEPKSNERNHSKEFSKKKEIILKQASSYKLLVLFDQKIIVRWPEPVSVGWYKVTVYIELQILFFWRTHLFHIFHLVWTFIDYSAINMAEVMCVRVQNKARRLWFVSVSSLYQQSLKFLEDPFIEILLLCYYR